MPSCKRTGSSIAGLENARNAFPDSSKVITFNPASTTTTGSSGERLTESMSVESKKTVKEAPVIVTSKNWAQETADEANPTTASPVTRNERS